MAIAWTVCATSGMAGADIDKKFVKACSIAELGYLMRQLHKKYRMVSEEFTKKVRESPKNVDELMKDEING